MRNKLGFFPNKQCFITFNNHSRPGSGNHRRALFSWYPGRVSLPLFHGLFSQKAHRPTLGLSKPEAQPVQTRGTKGSSSITHLPLATPRNTNLIQRTVPEELHWLWGTTTMTLPWALQHLLTQRCQIFSCLHMLFFMHAWDLVLSPTSPHSPPTLLYAIPPTKLSCFARRLLSQEPPGLTWCLITHWCHAISNPEQITISSSFSQAQNKVFLPHIHSKLATKPHKDKTLFCVQSGKITMVQNWVFEEEW